MDGWILRVADLQGEDVSQRGVIDTLVIVLAVTVILASLGFLAIAIRRERKSNELKSEFISNVSHAGRAEPALERVVLDERALHRVQLAARREPLDRRDRLAL